MIQMKFVKCPTCGHTLDLVLEEALGETLECRKCGYTEDIYYDSHKVDRLQAVKDGRIQKEGDGNG